MIDLKMHTDEPITEGNSALKLQHPYAFECFSRINHERELVDRT